LAIISLVVFVITLVYFPQTGQVMYRLPVSVMSLWLLIVLLDKNKGVPSRVFSNGALVYLGKISYGIYLFHNFVPEIYSRLSNYFMENGWKIPFTKYSILPYVGGPKQLVLYFAFLITVATVSWFCFEKPINNLKRYFDYHDD